MYTSYDLMFGMGFTIGLLIGLIIALGSHLRK